MSFRAETRNPGPGKENCQATVDLTCCGQAPHLGDSPFNFRIVVTRANPPSVEDGFRDSARNDGRVAYGTVASQTAQSEKAMIEFQDSLTQENGNE